MTERRAPLFSLVLACGVSVAGTAMSALAIPWLVLSTTGSAGRTGVVGFAEMAPYVLLQVLAGPVVDRIGAKRGCVLGNAVACVLVCAIPVFHAAGGLSFGVLVVLVAVGGAVRGMADTATGPLVPAMAKLGGVPLERAAGLYSGAGRTGLLLGTPLAGVLVAGAGAPATVLVDGITFGVAAVAVMVLVPAAGSGERPGGFLAGLGEGLRFIGTDRLLLGIVVLVAATNLLDQALLSVLVPVWIRDRLHDPASVGFLGGASNIGALLGVLLAAWIGHRLPRRAIFSLGYLLGGAPPFLAMAAFGTLAPVLVITGLAGLAGGVNNPIIGAVSYERIPEHLQARVLGAIKASAWTGIPFGSLLGGALTAGTGLTLALLACGAAMLVVTLAPFVFPAWRQLDRPGVTSSR
ncbi:MFS transporter [Amycolatopsis sp.]|uniref:MFS transporter n=1 Tax=Amycolatopsis sp. TaxID=37632 RepID=UPI002B54E8FA|nr:MFS transporter [Amycolatopsis sp.]HVV07633.1 MFS transporter [Amycolatopsis sp.]